MDDRYDPEDAARIARAREEESRGRYTTSALLTQVLSHLSNLVRKEVDLARAEMQQNAKKAAGGVGLLVGAVVLALVALNVLAAALVAALTEMGLAAGWAALIVGGAIALIAVIFAVIGAKALSATSLAPTRTMTNVRPDTQAVKEAV